ncbi:MAG: hypothetical protein IJ129_06820 [Ruminococcus sp.]|nr:hypothetical protein [Ruminococcus sp.]
MPMITYAALIIDASRLQAAKTAVSGAGELTANAAMSEYEQVVQDMYGLFAVVQDDADLEPALQDYFKKTINGALAETDTSSKTVEAQSEAITQWILQSGGSDDLNFDNMLYMDADSVSVKGVPSSALANPAVMKRQIIEYMKYQGPVSLASTLLSKLSFLKDSGKQTEAVEKKVEFDEAKKQLQSPCDAAYNACNDYNTKADEYNNAKASKSYEKMIENVKDHYTKMSKFFLMMNHSSVKYNDGKTYDYNALEEKTDVRTWDMPETVAGRYTDTSEFEKARDYYLDLVTQAKKIAHFDDTTGGKFTDYYVSASYAYNVFIFGYPKIQDTWKAPSSKSIYMDWIHNFKKSDHYTNNHEYAGSENADGLDFFIGSLYDRQLDYVKKLDEFREFKQCVVDIKTYANELYNNWDIYDNAYTKHFKEEYETEHEGEEYTDQDVTAYVNQKKNEDTGYQDTMKYKNQFIVMSNAIDGNSPAVPMLNSTIYADFNSLNTYDNFIWQLSNVFNSMYFYEAGLTEAKEAFKEMNEYYQYFKSLSDKAQTVIDKLNAIKTVMNNEDEGGYKKIKTDYENSVNNLPSGDTKEKMKSNMDTSLEGLKEEDIDNLISVAQGFKDYFDGQMSKMETVKFLKSSIVGPYNTSDNGIMYEGNQIYEKDDYIPNKEDWKASSWTTHAEKIVEDNFDLGEFVPGDVKDSGKFDGLKDDDLTKVEEKEQFYVTLESICKPKQETMSSEEENAVNNVENLSNEATNNAEPSSDDSSGSGDSGSGGGGEGGEEEKKGTDIGSILSAVQKYAKETKEQNETAQQSAKADLSSAKSVKVSKDKDSYDKSGKDAKGALSAAKKLLESLANIAETAVQYSYMEEYFTEMFSCDTDRLALTNNVPISTLAGAQLNGNTDWYGKEIEYILWGNSDLDANITANYALIYTIRFALNAIYAFTAADIQSFALELATAIAGWTVIGVPIVQAVITIGLALAESGVDIAKLKDGKDVAIYKSVDTFVCSPTGLTKEVVSTVVEKASEEVCKYVDETIDKAVDKMKGTVADNMDALKKKVTDYIDAQTDSLKTKVKDSYVTPVLNAVRPIMSHVNQQASNVKSQVETAIDNTFETIKTNIDAQDDGMLKSIEQKVYDTAGETLKQGLKDKFTTYFENVAKNIPNTESLEEIIDAKLDEIESSITDPIKEELDKIEQEMLDKLNEMVDEKVENVKGMFHDKMGEVSEKISGTINEHLSDATQKVTDASGGSGGFTLNYKEYCKIFIFIHIVTDENIMLNRCAALIQANVQNAPKIGEDDQAKPNFDITKAYTMMHVSSDVKIRTLFSWGAQTTFNEATGENDVGFSLGNMTMDSVTMKYDHVNGY